jgi:(p)ppGpp synthase/HD superfamily hydrolase
MTTLTQRYTEAVDYARNAHTGHYRKGTTIPYLYHLLGVSSLVLEHGGNEDQAIAGLLHDVLEDCGHEHAQPIRERFGEAVIAIVLACTDGTAAAKAAVASGDKRADWRARKLRYLTHLREESPAVLLVSACDKLHNARAIVGDLEDPAVGTAVFGRFTAGREGTLAYYHSLAQLFASRGSPVARALTATVERMHELANETRRLALD